MAKKKYPADFTGPIEENAEREPPKQPKSLQVEVTEESKKQPENKSEGGRRGTGQAQPIVNEDTGVVTGFISPQGVIVPNISPTQAKSMLNLYSQQRAIPTGAGGQAGMTAAQIAQQQEQQELTQEALTNLEQKQTIAERELSPRPTAGQSEIGGANLAALEMVSRTTPLLSPKGFYDKYIKGEEINEEEITGLSPENQRTAALTKAEERIIKKGLDLNEKLGAVVEAIPFGGWAAGALNIVTPSERVKDIESNLEEVEQFASDVASNAGQGLITPNKAIDLIEEYEIKLQEMEAKIKLNAVYSAELRANPEQLNKIETKIARIRQTFYEAKFEAATGGVKQEPNEYQIYNATKRLTQY